MPVGVVLPERLEVFPFLKIMPPPLWLNRVKWSPFIHSHCFYHHSQCLRTKIKFVCECGASRQSESISISKIKAPHLWLIWINGVHLYIPIFYYHSQSLPLGVVLVERLEIFPFLKIKPTLYATHPVVSIDCCYLVAWHQVVYCINNVLNQ